MLKKRLENKLKLKIEWKEGNILKITHTHTDKIGFKSTHTKYYGKSHMKNYKISQKLLVMALETYIIYFFKKMDIENYYLADIKSNGIIIEKKRSNSVW